MKRKLSKSSPHYHLHKDSLWCMNCNYFDFEDAFKERELVCFPDLDFLEDIYRIQYINYLRRKFSLVHSAEVRLHELKEEELNENDRTS